MMQVFSSVPVKPTHQVGDLVEWKGIKMIVAQVYEDGSVKAVSKTTIVHTTEVQDFKAL